MNIKDIAALAGVSTSTVSKVLNRKDTDISEATRERVLEIVQEHQYVPYSKIRKNTYFRSYYLEILIGELPFECTELVQEIGRCASEMGYCTVVNYLEKNRRQIRLLDGKDVDGIMVLGNASRYKEVIAEILVKQIPCIAVEFEKSNGTDIPKIVYAQEEAAYRAVSYLIEKGHSNIGCIFSENQGLRNGYQRALYENMIDFDESNIFEKDITTEEGQTRLGEWLGLSNTAIVCENEKQVICLYRILTKKGILVPDDVSVVALRDSFCLELLEPAVTTVGTFRKGLGKQILSFMLERVHTSPAKLKNTDNSVDNFADNSVDIPVEIQERASVKFPNKWQGQKIVAVGSLNLDVSISVGHIPSKGEALIATGTTLIPGGKGANEAIGAAKLGGKVYMIGCLGNDNDGKELYANLLKYKVRTDGIEYENTFSTGKAYINIPANDEGESTIIVYPGANRALGSSQIRKYDYLFDDAKYCLLSLEIPIETANYTASVCRKKQVKVILKPSGVEKISEELLKNITYFVPNKKEVDLLVPGSGSIEEKAERLYDMGVENVIVTLGKDGCYLKNKKYARHFPATDFESVDTTGGADAFISALAVYLSENVPLIRAIGFATYSAGITVTRQGVQPAMPDRIALEMYQDMITDTFTE